MFGDSLWTKDYNIIDVKSGKQTLDGGYIMVGNKNNVAVLLKTDSLGNQMFTKTYSYPNNYDDIWATQVVATQDGGYVISSIIEHQNWQQNWQHMKIYIIKTNNIGDTLWTNKLSI